MFPVVSGRAPKTSSMLITDHRMKSCAGLYGRNGNKSIRAAHLFAAPITGRSQILTCGHTFSQAVYTPFLQFTFCRIFASTPVVSQLVREQSHEHVIWLQSGADHALLIQMKKEQEKMSGNVAEAGTARPTGVAHLKRWAPLVILLGGIAAVYASGLHEYLSLTAIADNRDALMAFVADNSVLAAAIYLASMPPPSHFRCPAPPC